MSTNAYEVNAVTKPNRLSPHDHITFIGNNFGDGWRLHVDIAIEWIESKHASFYTIDETTGVRIHIGVVRVMGKRPYLRTYADGKWSDNLLALPECKPTAKLVA